MLSMDSLPTYRFSSFRYFDKGEHHMERTFREDVLLLVMDGVLRFHKDGTPVEIGSYINLYKEFRKQEHCPPAKWRSANTEHCNYRAQRSG